MHSTPGIVKADLPRLNIGSGRAPKPKEEGWINCDLYHAEGVDVVFDALGPWPFKNESILEVYSNHVLEHLDKPMNFFREAWRVLVPNGKMVLQLPYGWHQSAWWDLTHLRPWVQESFAILQPGFTHYTRNLQHERMGFAFWVWNTIIILDKRYAPWWRIAPLRPIIRWLGHHTLNVFRDLLMEAVKTTEDDPRSSAFGGQTNPCIVPSTYGAIEHEYYGRSGEGLKFFRLIVFDYRKPVVAGN